MHEAEAFTALGYEQGWLASARDWLEIAHSPDHWCKPWTRDVVSGVAVHKHVHIIRVLLEIALPLKQETTCFADAVAARMASKVVRLRQASHDVEMTFVVC